MVAARFAGRIAAAQAASTRAAIDAVNTPGSLPVTQIVATAHSVHRAEPPEHR